MKKSFFHLGSTPRLSAEEIIRSFPNADHSFFHSQNLMVISVPPEEGQKIFPFLGGSMRMGEVVFESPSLGEVETAITDLIEKTHTEGKKMRIGINVFPERKYKVVFNRIFTFLKNDSKASGYSLRIINRPGKSVDTSTAEKEGLLKEGNHELSIFFEGENVILTKTLAVQNIASFASRDFGKPVRDMQVGMLPPKLARMMVNLSRNGRGELPSHLWDAFCGTGTVLLEALDMGIGEVMGSDLSEKMVDASRKNIAYFSPPGQGTQKKRTFQHDATRNLANKNPHFGKSEYSFTPQSHDFSLSHFVVVSEGFLGRTFTHEVLEKEFYEQKDILLPLYEKFLSARKNEGIKKIILAIPFWKGKEKEFSFSYKLLETAKKIGYDSPAPMRYRREKQFTGREIMIFDAV